MVPVHFPLLVVAAAACLARVSAIMVPTGKLGPITPPKPSPQPIPAPAPALYRSPAPVWERIDESDSGYKPPVYKYILWDYVQKYGHHTLIPRQQDYYNPPPQVNIPDPFIYKKTPYVGKGAFSYHKNKGYYSQLQFL